MYRGACEAATWIVADAADHLPLALPVGAGLHHRLRPGAAGAADGGLQAWLVCQHQAWKRIGREGVPARRGSKGTVVVSQPPATRV